MTNPVTETTSYPFTTFNFAIEIEVPGVSQKVYAAQPSRSATGWK